jgi:hypothetical protein
MCHGADGAAEFMEEMSRNQHFSLQRACARVERMQQEFTADLRQVAAHWK